MLRNRTAAWGISHSLGLMTKVVDGRCAIVPPREVVDQDARSRLARIARYSRNSAVLQVESNATGAPIQEADQLASRVLLIRMLA